MTPHQDLVTQLRRIEFGSFRHRFFEAVVFNQVLMSIRIVVLCRDARRVGVAEEEETQ